jgi:hypothetical protein
MGANTLGKTIDEEHVMALLEHGQNSYTSALASSQQCCAFLEHATTQIGIDQATPHFIGGDTKVGIRKPLLGGPAVDPLGLEGTHFIGATRSR